MNTLSQSAEGNRRYNAFKRARELGGAALSNVKDWSDTVGDGFSRFGDRLNNWADENRVGWQGWGVEHSHLHLKHSHGRARAPVPEEGRAVHGDNGLNLCHRKAHGSVLMLLMLAAWRYF
jgi:hypothetical protein